MCLIRIEALRRKGVRANGDILYYYERKGRGRGVEYPISGCKVTKLDLYEHYEKFCRDFGLAPESPQSFSRKLKDDFHLNVKRGRINGELAYCWMDVRVRNWQEEERKLLDQLEDFSDTTKEEMK